MDVRVVVCFLFLTKQTMADSKIGVQENLSHKFVAVVVEESTSRIAAVGVVLSHHWVLTVAHVFPPDSNGLEATQYVILAGQPFKVFQPSFAITHPAYTWGLYTAEDFALFHVNEYIETRPVFISAGRFPWNEIECDFIYRSETVNQVGFPKSFKSEVTVLQNCLTKKQRKPTGLLQFYMNDLLCGRSGEAHPDECVGNTGGILYCENLLVGFLIRREWCQNKTANFTDVGEYTNWLQSRVSDGHFIRLYSADAAAGVSQPGEVITIVVAYLLSDFARSFFGCFIPSVF